MQLEVVRLPFNEYAHIHVRDLERRLGRPAQLSEQFDREIHKPNRGLYLGVYSGEDLIGCARLVTELLGAVVLDAFEVEPDHPCRRQVELALLQAARALAAEHGKRLSVIAYPQVSKRWTEMGFHLDAQALLTLP